MDRAWLSRGISIVFAPQGLDSIYDKGLFLWLGPQKLSGAYHFPWLSEESKAK